MVVFQLESFMDFQVFSPNCFVRLPRKRDVSIRPFHSQIVCSGSIARHHYFSARALTISTLELILIIQKTCTHRQYTCTHRQYISTHHLYRTVQKDNHHHHLHITYNTVNLCTQSSLRDSFPYTPVRVGSHNDPQLSDNLPHIYTYTSSKSYEVKTYSGWFFNSKNPLKVGVSIMPFRSQIVRSASIYHH